jgi:DNA/RNA-binding domain of Phe-tRNA-synthetase-like protein
MTGGTTFDFHFDESLRERGVTGAYSLLLGADQSLTPPNEIAAFVDGVIAGVRERAVRDLITADPVYAGFRDLHKSFGVPTRKLLSAAETLIRYVEKRGDIPRIGPLVDVYNAVSLETKLSLGAHDLATVTGGISVRLTTGAERYHPVGAAEPEPVRPGEYGYIDGGGTSSGTNSGEVICRLEVRQSEKTKVTPATRDVFLIVQGNAATPPAYVQAGHDRLISLLQRFFGGEAVPLYRS